MLRKAFEKDNVIPHDILWRKKEAFSDGVSQTNNSWHSILKEYINSQYDDIEFEKMKENCVTNIPLLKETAFYRSLFHKHFKFEECNVPYYWLPKFSGDIIDPSAREII